MEKKIWMSKTFWVNILSVAVVIVQTQTGFVINAEAQIAILGVINLVLRMVTNKPVVWKNGKPDSQ